MAIEIILEIDFDKLCRTKFCRFGLFYHDKFVIGNEKLIPKDNTERVAFFLFHLAGKFTLFCMRCFLFLYLKLLSEEEREEFIKGFEKKY